MKSDYQVFYEKITSGFDDTKKKILIALNKYTTYLFYTSYPLLLVYVFFKQRNIFWKTFLIPLISFVILSLARKLIDRKRPYEAHQIHPIIQKDTKGNSMPSRHIFSSAIISMCFLYVNVYIGILFLVLTIVSACVRVVGGVHYPSDVIAGFVSGIFCGFFMFL